MCGIFFLSHNKNSINKVTESFDLLTKRGPDNSNSLILNDYYFGFKRLIINDFSEKGNQPFKIDDIILICNGEIYNYKELIEEYKLDYSSNSDCEVILRLYQKIGMDKTIKALDGVFAFVLYDKKSNIIYSGRDRIGIRPLFFVNFEKEIGIASEAKTLVNLGFNDIKQFPSGNYLRIEMGEIKFFEYFSPYSLKNSPIVYSENLIYNKTVELLENAVRKRLLSDRPIGCLLSGGLDSSIIAYLLNKLYNKKIKTFSIGFKNSPDLKNAKKVAKFLDTDHYELEITPEKALESIDIVIKTIESYDITTVRASVWMYLLSEYISKNFDETVIFSGEGADEVCCGYLYFHSNENSEEIDKESKRLIQELPYFDVLRADRCTAVHSLELRVPFLDKDFLNFYLSLKGDYKKPKNGIEKYFLRKSFEEYLPKEIIWRKKEAFSDGVSENEKSWHKIIEDYLDKKITREEYISNKDKYKVNPPISKESYYYRKIYEKYYSKQNLIPHFWLPKWNDKKDPSARELEIYKN